MRGSSPLTRGKPRLVGADLPPGRLIPAHAGKTRCISHDSPPLAAHPRSRGENSGAGSAFFGVAGSSPLTRGKLDRRAALLRGDRLIPAHAGKTHRQQTPALSLPAHPRSRGENFMTRCSRPRLRGSSPLTRGKPDARDYAVSSERLIPAHAGKTTRSRYRGGICAAHPRSRGENVNTITAARAVEGSSPLTRGKLDGGGLDLGRDRLIPAHAGKTN